MTTLAIMQARAALRMGGLVQDGSRYRFGRRLFDARTINALRANGERINVTLPKRRDGKKQVQVHLTAEEYDAIRKIAGDEDRPIANAARRLIAEAIKARAEKDQPS